jgi:hypothetical protein
MIDFGAYGVEFSDHISRVLEFIFHKIFSSKTVHITWHLLTGHVGATWVR